MYAYCRDLRSLSKNTILSTMLRIICAAPVHQLVCYRIVSSCVQYTLSAALNTMRMRYAYALRVIPMDSSLTLTQRPFTKGRL